MYYGALIPDHELDYLAYTCGHASHFPRVEDVIHYGDLYRLISPWKDRIRCVWSYVSADKSEALVTYVVMRSGIYQRHYFRLAGLDHKRLYRNETNGQVLPGSTWMNAGVCIQEVLRDYTSRVIHFTAVD